MRKRFLFVFLFSAQLLTAQTSLEYYLSKGTENSPVLKEYKALRRSNSIQGKINYAQNSGWNVYLSADYLFAPYFNNGGRLISANPDPKAVGYDIGITNGGLYSAQLNASKNLFNGSLTDALERQIKNQDDKFDYYFNLEKHNLAKGITDTYLNACKSLLQYQLAGEITGNLKNQIDITESLTAKGMITARDYMLLKIEYGSRKMNAEEAYARYKNDLTKLKSLCGITDTATVFLEPAAVRLSGETVVSNFDKKFGLDSLSAVNEKEVIDTQYLPKLNVFANTGLNAVELDGIQRKFGFSAGLSFSLPLYDGNQKDLFGQQNLIARETISGYRDYSKVTVESQKSSSLLLLNSLRKNIDELDLQISDFRKIINLSEKQMQSGELSMIEYLTLLKNFTELRLSKLEKEIDYQIEINNYNYWNW